MKKIIKKSFTKKQVTLEGMMTFGMLENGLRIADFGDGAVHHQV